jgi:class 3 adenylate cyclase
MSRQANNNNLSPFCEDVYATVLFADISGFTRLSSHIDVESLKRHIKLDPLFEFFSSHSFYSTFFTMLLGVVRQYNGDVIKFCGDAVMIIWPVAVDANQEIKAATAYLAASCAIALLTTCGQYCRMEKNYKILLRLHCGIASGQIHCMCLGLGDRWEFLISGEPLRQVGVAESEAGIGEVCMSEDSYALVSDRFDAVEMPEGSMNLILPKLHIKIPSRSPSEMSMSGAMSERTPSTIPERAAIPSDMDILNKLLGEQSISLEGGASEQKNSTIGTPNQNSVQISLSLSSQSVWKSSLFSSSSIFPPINSPSANQPRPKIESSRDVLLGRNVQEAKSFLENYLSPGYVPPRILFPVLHKFLMIPAKNAIDHDTLNYVAELRQVVTIFIEILGLEDDFNMGFVRRPQRVISTVLECLDRYSGSLRQYLVDDKGCVIIAAFGLPGSAHEDNCVRAIESSTAIRDMLLSFKILCRIGIAQGSVFCGLVGSLERCEYAMMGSSVNLAARLMGKGEGGNILVNHTVHDATVSSFKFHSLQKIKAKGYAKPVPVFVPYERIHLNVFAAAKQDDSAETDADMGSSPTKQSKVQRTPVKRITFIGREEELKTFQMALTSFAESTPLGSDSSSRATRSKAGAHQAHVIEGVAGVGKTWLVKEIIKQAQHFDTISPIFVCSIGGQTQQSTPYFVFRHLLEQIFGITLVNKQMTSTASPLNRGASFSKQRVFTPRQNVLSKDQIPSSIIASVQKWLSQNSTGDGLIGPTTSEVPDPIRKLPDHMKGESSTPPMVRSSPSWKNFSMNGSPRKSGTFDNLHTINSQMPHPGEKAARQFLKGLTKSRDMCKVGVEYEEDYSVTGATPEPADSSGKEKYHYMDLLPLLGDILGIELENNLLTSSLSFTARIAYCHSLILYIMELALERKKALFIVENIQWCDAASLACLSSWLEVKSGCFFLCTARTSNEAKITGSSASLVDINPAFSNSLPHQRRDSLRLHKDSNTAHLLNSLLQQCASTALHMFSQREIVLVLKSTIDSTLITQAAQVFSRANLEKIQKHTEGSPILTQILAVELGEALRRGEYRSIDDLPSGYHALILTRFDKLSTTDQIILKIASVIGQSFSKGELAEVLYRQGSIHNAQTITDALVSLVNSNLIQHVDSTAGDGTGGGGSKTSFSSEGGTESENEGDGGGGDTHFCFVNKSVQDGIYYLMLEGQRKAAHAVYGQMLDEQYRDHPNPSIFFSALFHFSKSDNTLKKYEYLLKAAEMGRMMNDNYTTNNCYGELILMKTDTNVTGMLAGCTDLTPVDARFHPTSSSSPSNSGFLSSFSRIPLFSLKPSRYNLPQNSSYRNLLQILGFSPHRKWVQVREMRTRFSTGDAELDRDVWVWSGHIARARFK